nr:thrombospondin type 3 repeat-containing protein [uncultured Flavobacterium sp.]
MKKTTLKLILIICCIFISIKFNAQRIVQDIDRGVVAIHSETSKVFVSWRLFATEPSNIGFNLYRSSGGGAAVKLNTAVLTAGTNFTDVTANFTVSNEYFVKTVLNGVEQEPASRSFVMPANTPIQSYMSFPLRQDRAGYAVRYVRAGDLDGDGDYDFIIVRRLDSSFVPDSTSTILVEAYKQDGTFLWQLDCGPNGILDDNNIEPGSSTIDVGHGDNITVCDINSDGKAEVIIRTANGVKFGDGSVLNYPADDRVQFISVLNGMTGAEISRTQYNNPYLVHGAMNGHFGIAYLDGIHPSLVWEAKNRRDDGVFNEMTTAWDWKNGTFVQKWQFFLDQYPPQEHQQTGHQIRIMDVDGDGKDEIISIGFAIDDDGSMLYNLADQDIFHGDRFFTGDLDPNRPGLETYGIQQGYSVSGIMWYYCDAKTGEVLLDQKDPANRDMARGNVGDFDPRFSGYELNTFTDYLYNVSGAPTSNGNVPYPEIRIFWDGDLLSENIGDKRMRKWNYLRDKEDRIFIDGFSTFSGIHDDGPNAPALIADILGDWREEVVYESSDFKELRIYTTPFPSTERIYTLSQNPGYLASMSVRGYYQALLTDYYIGDGMLEPPVSPIQKADKYWTGVTSSDWDATTSNWETNSGSALYADPNIVMFDTRGNNSNPINLSGNFSPAKVWVMNPEGKDYIFSGTGKLTGTMDFVKSLTGSVTFNGNYDYTGTTVISDGVFNVNGSIESKVTVKSKGTIGGVGVFKGGVVLEKGLNINGGRINPGKGMGEHLIGSLVINGDLIVPGNNNFAFDIVPGSTKVNDDVIVNGNLSFSEKNRLIIVFKDGIAIEGTYTLIKSTATLTAVAADFIVEGINGVPNEIIIENNQIKLKILALRDPGTIVWKGQIDNKWDFKNKNFNLNGVQEAFVPKDVVVFDETASNKTVQLTEIATTSGVNFNATTDYTLGGTGVIDGAGDLIKSNINKVTLNLTKNSYTGKTIINGGTLSVSNIENGGKPSSLGASGKSAGNLVVNDATLEIINNSTTDRIVTITGTSTINTSTIGKHAVFVGDITGSGDLVKDGPGSMFLLHNNSYSGTTTLKEGNIYLRGALGNVSGLGTLGKITIESGSLIMDDRQLHDQPYWDIDVPLGKTGTFIPDGRCELYGKLTGAGTLNVTTPFIRSELRGDWSSFTGVLNINGEFRINNTYGYANATVNFIGNGLDGTIPNSYHAASSSTTIKFGALNGIATAKLYNARWEIGGKNIDSQYDGVIASTMLTKVGTGSLILTNVNTYTGATNVNGGKLIVNNTTGSGAGTGTLTINTGGTLSGTGILSNTISVASGGKLNPGYPFFGTLTINKAVTLQSGSTYETDVNAGTNASDLLAVGANALVLNGTLKITNQNGSAFTVGNIYNIFNGSNISGNFVQILPARPGAALKWDVSKLKTDGIIAVVTDPLYVDTDNDGVEDSLDLCPNTPSGQTVNASGCAQSQLDDDNDGVKNSLDTCPNTPSGQTVNSSGCAQSQLDDDNDGVKNNLDTCPNTPSGQTVNASGCAQSQLDDDNDGVKNNLDLCPNTPSGQAVNASGCAQSQLDDDNDGVKNNLDTCPNTPVGETVNASGCAQSELDDDNDGVKNNLDLCPSTPSGTTVNSQGCTVISSTAIKVYVETSSCPGKSNGKISIATNLNGYTYMVKVKGGSIDQTLSNVSITPTTPQEISNLAVGTYQVTVSIPAILFEQSYGVVVNEISPIIAKRVENDKMVSYAVSGSNQYTVTVNGISRTYITGTVETSIFEIDASLLQETNVVSIETNSDCQGIVSDTFALNPSVLVHPNPTSDIVYIENVSKGLIQVYTNGGALLIEKNAENTKSIDLKGYAAGMYLVKITQGAEIKTFKVILK